MKGKHVESADIFLCAVSPFISLPLYHFNLMDCFDLPVFALFPLNVR
jgi:hypothetical protein